MLRGLAYSYAVLNSVSIQLDVDDDGFQLVMEKALVSVGAILKNVIPATNMHAEVATMTRGIDTFDRYTGVFVLEDIWAKFKNKIL